ncbi:hypothetical protein BDV96DRAFT_610064 [Lophiotrema nucula]|uniref:Aminoglycoside phosphotransferase domain-containing protein n=1 Tax=Lophiotrema nucula TaxID=690887 RepID=A0A6A5ZKU0_9PLEO|nr:hypothetical protein BDV96DRAFT_610064 [Lophiotrema nucula]
MSPNISTGFWTRNELDERDVRRCIGAVKDQYPIHVVEELEDQGYCSYTLLISPLSDASETAQERGKTGSTIKKRAHDLPCSYIVQIRPEQHLLDIEIARTAIETYGSLAPAVRTLDLLLPPRLQAFELSYLEGVPYTRRQSRTPQLDPSTWQKQAALVQSFAAVIARSWDVHARTAYSSRSYRADSPIQDNPDCLLSLCRGRVGSQIFRKLHYLSQNLPDASLRQKTKHLLSRLQALEDLPAILNHGDLIPSNILIDEETWQIKGLVDWAEAEVLPFGTCLYGLEHLLGYFDASDVAKPRFVYYGGAPRLREMFWTRLEEEVPESRGLKEKIMLARDVGVLLWFGYAWDEGAIDRVVNNEDDREELECLRKFLDIRKD